MPDTLKPGDPGYTDQRLRVLVRTCMIRELYGNDRFVCDYARECAAAAFLLHRIPKAQWNTPFSVLFSEDGAFRNTILSAVRKACEAIRDGVYDALLTKEQIQQVRSSWDSEFSGYIAAAEAQAEITLYAEGGAETPEVLGERAAAPLKECCAELLAFRQWEKEEKRRLRRHLAELGKSLPWDGPEHLSAVRTPENRELLAKLSEEELCALIASGRVIPSTQLKKLHDPETWIREQIREARQEPVSWQDRPLVKPYTLSMGDAHSLKEWRSRVQDMALQLQAEERKQIEEERQAKLRALELSEKLLTAIPEHYRDLYPLARTMKRRFILHLGPTNSGKTFEAVERLSKAKSGVYLGPLRLLAYEQYEKLGAMGTPCSLITGEERILTPGAQIVSSTVEMADLRSYCEVGVIDEAQLITDPERGGAWSAAILGLPAEEIHVLASPDAEDILVRVIEECGDTVSIRRHERLTSLSREKVPFRFPADASPGDALIVFSRKSVHAAAAAMQAAGKTCSLIYGALPYDVRHEQAGLFASGKTDIVVATDAIGLGMNLPIRRVVFLETEKFDGTRVRSLLPSEIRQIAGRAGRYSIYDSGFYTGLSADALALLKNGVEGPCPPPGKPVITFPASLLSIDGTLKELLERWDALDPHEGWERSRTKRSLFLLSLLPEETDKALAYRLVTMPFDEKDQRLVDLWLSMAGARIRKKPFDTRSAIPDAGSSPSLEELEHECRVLDLLYTYLRCFEPSDALMDEVMRQKYLRSQAILEFLERQASSPGSRGYRVRRM